MSSSRIHRAITPGGVKVVAVRGWPVRIAPEDSDSTIAR